MANIWIDPKRKKPKELRFDATNYVKGRAKKVDDSLDKLFKTKGARESVSYGMRWE